MPPLKFQSALRASSYHDPDNRDAYEGARKLIIDRATSLGYERSTMIEHGITWADDLDPFGHVKSAAFTSMFAISGVRVFESFSSNLGSKFEGFMKARDVSAVAREFTINLKRPVTYPDSVGYMFLPGDGCC